MFFMHGRPSSFRDELIDAPYPEDLSSLGRVEDLEAANHINATARSGWSRAMAQIGKIADRIFVEIYSTQTISNMTDAFKGPAIYFGV